MAKRLSRRTQLAQQNIRWRIIERAQQKAAAIHHSQAWGAIPRQIYMEDNIERAQQTKAAARTIV